MAKKKNIRTYQRGSTWTYSFETARVGGKRKPVTKGGFATEADAYKAGMIALADYVNGLKISRPVNISYGDFLNMWLKDMYIHEVRKTTYQAHMSLTRNHIIPKLGHVLLTDISVTHIKGFLNDLKLKGYTKKTLAAFKFVIVRSLNSAINDYGYIQINPARNVQLPRIESPARKGTLTADDKKKLFEYFTDINDRIALMLGLSCGLRIGEAFAVTWDDIDLDKKTITINKQIGIVDNRTIVSPPKNDSSNRVIPFDDQMLSEFKKLKKQRLKEKLKSNRYPDTLLYEDARINEELTSFDFIFRTSNGSLYHRYRLTEKIKQFRKETGIDVHFHLLRHTHCTDLITSGAPLPAIQKRLGHSSIKTTMEVYASVSTEQDEHLKDILNTGLYANL